MKIFFQASIFHKKKMAAEYKRIFEYLISKDYDVLGDVMSVSQEIVQSRKKEDHEKYIKRFKQMILDCDVVCAEMTYPSTMHMGFKVCYALQRNKPVIVLHKKSEYQTSFFDVLGSDKLVYEEYNENNLEEVLKGALEYIDKKSDARFNFFLPSDQVDFIDQICQEENISKSAALRKVIAKAMGKD